MTVAVISFDGVALAWYWYMENRNSFVDWDDLKNRLFKRFQPSKEGKQCAKLLAIKQETTVTEFRERFEALAAPLLRSLMRFWRERS